MTALTQARLKEKLDYDPVTGIFRWKDGKRFGGKVAGWQEKHGYTRISLDRKTYYAHRLAHLYMNGAFPNGEVDHENQNRGDNRWSNISKWGTKSENKRNNSLRSNNTSGFNGVSWNKTLNKWEARITADGQKMRLGGFDSYTDACDARVVANIKYGFHPNHGINKTQYEGL